MISLYIADIGSLPDPKDEPKVLEGLSLERRDKINRQQKLQKRKQSLGAGLLIKEVLAQKGINEDAVTKDVHGKPQVEGLHFNLSHTGNIVVCAIAEAPVGCDVESVRTAPDGVAEHFFCKNERNYLEQFEGERYDEEFYRIWTLKESYVKMTGEGMALTRGVYELVLNEDVKVLRAGKVQSCRFVEYKTKGCRIAVCSGDVKFSPNVIEIVLN